MTKSVIFFATESNTLKKSIVQTDENTITLCLLDCAITLL